MSIFFCGSLTRVRRIGLALLLVSVANAPACAPAPEPPQAAAPVEARSSEPEADFAALLALDEQWYRAFSAGDAAAIAALYVDECSEMPPNQPIVAGREAVQSWYADLFAGAKVEIGCHPLESWVGGDWAFHRCAYSISATPSGQAEASTDSGQHIYILRRAGEGWKILRGIWVSERPPSERAGIFVHEG